MEGEDSIALDLKDVPSKVTSSSILFWADALALQNISEQVNNSRLALKIKGKNRRSYRASKIILFQRRLFP
jgi:hypothetical protein